MDLVRELKEVRFELALRGYDCEAVDAFLAKLRGDIVSAQEDHADQRARIAELEGMIEDGGGSTETEGTLRRTLVLAQRLADETEAEAKKAAAELVEAATAESEAMRSAAQAEATSMREAGKSELDEAREAAESSREAANEESAKSRATARSQADAILAQAEATGVERVAVIEQAAQQEAAAMRESIRAEVSELEAVRARLLGDIAELESHLEEQRDRVRNAVDALRAGMSGSIEDLERVADDDELLAAEPAPEHSGATGADVDAAPDVEIVDAVAASAPPPPSVDEVEEAALAAMTPIDEVGPEDSDGQIEVVDDAADEAIAEVADPTDDEVIAEVADPTDDEVIAEPVAEMLTGDLDGVQDPWGDSVEEAIVDGDSSDGWVTHEPDGVIDPAEVVAEAPMVDVFEGVEPEPAVEDIDGGPMTEPIPVVEMATESDLDDADLVVLDEEPSALFGTDVGDDASVEDADDDPETARGPGFIQRFTEAVDQLPVVEP